MYFVDRGNDLATLNKSFESMPLEQQEELSKALKKDGLVQKQVTVQGKHGTYTQMKWVRAGDDKKDNTKQPKQAVGDDSKTDVQKECETLINNSNLSDANKKALLSGVYRKHMVALSKDGEIKTAKDWNEADYAKTHGWKVHGSLVDSIKDGKLEKELGGKPDKPNKQQAAPQGDKPKKSAAPSKETKAAVSDLRKQHGADKVMAAAKAAGITWKENVNEGINWMRCAMAMASSGKVQAVTDNLSGKANAKPKKQPKIPKAKDIPQNIIDDAVANACDNLSTDITEAKDSDLEDIADKVADQLSVDHTVDGGQRDRILQSLKDYRKERQDIVADMQADDDDDDDGDDGSTPAKSGSDSDIDFSTPRNAKGKPEKMPKDPDATTMVKYTPGSASGEYSKKLTEAAGFDPEQTGIFVKENADGVKTFIIDNGQSHPNEIGGEEMVAMIEESTRRGKGQKAKKFTRKLSQRIVDSVSESTKTTVDKMADRINQLKILPLDKNSDAYKREYDSYRRTFGNSNPDKLHDMVVYSINKHNKAVKNLKALAPKLKNPKISVKNNSSGTEIQVKFKGVNVGEVRKMFSRSSLFQDLSRGDDNGLYAGGDADQYQIKKNITAPGVAVRSHFNSEYQAEDSDPLTLKVIAYNYSDSDMGGAGNHDLYWDSNAKEWKQ